MRNRSRAVRGRDCAKRSVHVGAARRAAGARQRCANPLAARSRPRGRDDPAHRPGGGRPGHATVPTPSAHTLSFEISPSRSPQVRTSVCPFYPPNSFTAIAVNATSHPPLPTTRRHQPSVAGRLHANAYVHRCTNRPMPASPLMDHAGANYAGERYPIDEGSCYSSATKKKKPVLASRQTDSALSSYLKVSPHWPHEPLRQATRTYLLSA